MNEVLRWPESECARVRNSLASLLDGDLAEDQSAWPREHLRACADCRAVLAGFEEIDRELAGWGERLGSGNPPRANAREQLAARLGSRPASRRPAYWKPAAVAAFAAVLVIAVILSGVR